MGTGNYKQLTASYVHGDHFKPASFVILFNIKKFYLNCFEFGFYRHPIIPINCDEMYVNISDLLLW